MLPGKEKETQARKLWTMGKPGWLAGSSGLSGKPHFCLMVNVIPCCKADALRMTKILLENVFSTWDMTSTLSSDQGTHFTGQIIRAIAKIL